MDDEKIAGESESKENDASSAEIQTAKTLPEAEEKQEEETEVFFGRGYHSVDDKNRIKLPIEIRNQLGKRKFRMAKGPERKVYIYTAKRADEILKNMHAVVKKNAKNRTLIQALKAFTSSMTSDVEVDSQDRFNFPQWLMDWGGIKKKDSVVTYGFDDHFEIERAEEYDNENAEISDIAYNDALWEFLS